MEFDTVEEFKKWLQETIESQNMKNFESLRKYCPFPSVNCFNCPLSMEETQERLIGVWGVCPCGSMTGIYCDYYNKKIDKETVLAESVLEGIKLLAYLDSKE